LTTNEILVMADLVAVMPGQLLETVHREVVVAVRAPRTEQSRHVHDAENAAGITLPLEVVDRIVRAEERAVRLDLVVHLCALPDEWPVDAIEVDTGKHGHEHHERTRAEHTPRCCLPQPCRDYGEEERDPEAGHDVRLVHR